MSERKTINDNKILYISGYGDDSNETVVYALEMPVSVVVNIDDDGTASIEFWEKAADKPERMVCRTGVIPDVAPPAQFEKLKQEKNLEEVVAKTIAGWMVIYMRDGVFCTDPENETFVRSFDLRDVMVRTQKNLEVVYDTFREDYQ